MRVTIVGQAPAWARGHARPLEGPCGERLARLAGLGSYAELRRRARLVNLVLDFPGKCGKGDAFPAREARARAARMRPRGIVVLAGRNVARAFGVKTGFFEWTELRGARCVVVPHPSGISHWWNDPANRAAAAEFLAGLFGAS